MNPAHAARRTAKAVAVIAALDKAAHQPATLQLLEDMERLAIEHGRTSTWTLLAGVTGGRRISEGTQAAVCALLAAREAVPTYPFAGLGGGS